MKLIATLIFLSAVLLSPASAETTLQYMYIPQGSWEFTKCRRVEIGGQYSMICVNNNIVLADNSLDKDGELRCVRVLSTRGKLLRKWGSFKRPAGIVRDKAGNYYVLDARAHKVYKYSSQYKPIKSWGSEGTGDGQMKFASGLAISTDDCLYISDKSTKRIIKFSIEGKYLGKFGEDVLELPIGVAADKKGNIWVADKKLVRKFNQKGELLDSYDLDPAGTNIELLSTITVAPDGIVYVGTLSSPSLICGINANGDLISVSMSAAQAMKGYGARPQDLYDGMPCGICFVGDKMFVVDPSRFRMMVFKKRMFTAAEKKELDSTN